MGAVKRFLARETAVLGLPMWGVIGALIGAAAVLVMCVSYLWIKSRRRATFTDKPQNRDIERDSRAAVPQEREEDRPLSETKGQPAPALAAVAPLAAAADVSQKAVVPFVEKNDPTVADSVPVESDKGQTVACPKSGDSEDGGSNRDRQAVAVAPECSYYGWGHWYTLKDLHDATDGFSASNVIGQGGYGVVYSGVLPDQTQIAVKNLLNNREQADREFKVEVEAIGRVRHKNLVKLIGYCAEGTQRLLVYEYLDNGNLEQWLHGDVGPVSPLTWELRIKIILGTARGLMYLHEGLEPKVVHRDIKASNILLDKQWNAKVSDFGLAKFLGPERTYVTTRVMGTFGYVAPEYASTGMLNESSDVYSFGILIMQIISGRIPVDYSRPPGEVNLVEWLKVMVSNRNSDGVLDPKLPEAPDSRALKKALLVALRCVDPDSTKRPKMSHVIHMLEVDDFPYPERRVGGPGRSRDRSLEKQSTGSGIDKDSSSILGANGAYRWRRQEK